MTKSKIVSAIELGSSKIVTLIAQVNIDPVSYERTTNIVGVSSVSSQGIKKGQIVDIEEAVESAISSVEAAERMAGYNLDSAWVCLGGAHIMSQNSHGVVAVSDPQGEVSPEDIERVIEAASAISLPSSREIVHVLPREFTVDGESGVKDAVGMSGVRLEVETHIITASTSSLKNLRRVVKEVGVDIEEIVFSGLSGAEAVLSETEKELGCCYIDLGGGTTSIAVYVDGAIAYSGVIPIGARNVTNDLAIGLRVSLDTAEKIKIALSESARKKKDKTSLEDDQLELDSMGITEVKKVSKKTLIEGIIKPRLNEIFSIVRLDLEKAGLSARIPSGIIVSGGGAETVGILESAKRTISLPVRIGTPSGVSGLVDDIMTPAFASSIGLILYAAKTEPQEHLTSFAKMIKLSSKGIFGKFIETIKDLLP